MTTRPGYVWDNTASEWVEIGQAAVLAPVKYQATAPSSPATGDIWIESDVDVPSVDSAQFLRWRKTMTGGETSLSGNDDSSLPLGYTPGYEQLYINGVLMVRGVDYTATTGTTVTALTALVANDVVEVFSALARTVADVYTQTQSDARFVNRNVGGLNLVVPTGATNGTVGANGAVTVGTAVSSVTVSGAFSAAYDNYKIIVSGGTQSTDDSIRLQFGATTTGYYDARPRVTIATGAITANATNNGSNSAVGYGRSTGLSLNVEVMNPFLTTQTQYFSNGYFLATNVIDTVSGFVNNNTSYTGFTLIPNSGNMTGGTIKIYGYNNGA